MGGGRPVPVVVGLDVSCAVDMEDIVLYAVGLLLVVLGFGISVRVRGEDNRVRVRWRVQVWMR